MHGRTLRVVVYLLPVRLRWEQLRIGGSCRPEQIARLKREQYETAMHHLRLLIVLIAGLGLALQASAVAAMPAADVEEHASGCAEMLATERMPMPAEPSGQDLPDCCKDMAYSCMMGMGCQPLVGLAGQDGSAFATGPGDRLYQSFVAKSLHAQSGGPEPPPPQAHS